MRYWRVLPACGRVFVACAQTSLLISEHETKTFSKISLIESKPKLERYLLYLSSMEALRSIFYHRATLLLLHTFCWVCILGGCFFYIAFVFDQGVTFLQWPTTLFKPTEDPAWSLVSTRPSSPFLPNPKDRQQCSLTPPVYLLSFSGLSLWQIHPYLLSEWLGDSMVHCFYSASFGRCTIWSVGQKSSTS